MKEKMLTWAVSIILERLKSEDIKRWIDAGLDMLEEKAKATPNKVDDALLKVLREALSIPEYDDE